MDSKLVAEVSRLHEAAWQDQSQWEVALGRAEQLLRQHLEAEPSCTEALTSLGALLSDSGRPGEALVALRHALSLRSSDANTYYNLAVALMNTDERGAAPRYFAQAAARRALPTTLRAYFDPHGH